MCTHTPFTPPQLLNDPLIVMTRVTLEPNRCDPRNEVFGMYPLLIGVRFVQIWVMSVVAPSANDQSPVETVRRTVVDQPSIRHHFVADPVMQQLSMGQVEIFDEAINIFS